MRQVSNWHFSGMAFMLDDFGSQERSGNVTECHDYGSSLSLNDLGNGVRARKSARIRSIFSNSAFHV
jgi:hypothetical protein